MIFIIISYFDHKPNWNFLKLLSHLIILVRQLNLLKEEGGML